MRELASAKVRWTGIRTTPPADGYLPWRLPSRSFPRGVFRIPERPLPKCLSDDGARPWETGDRRSNRYNSRAARAKSNAKLWHNSGASASKFNPFARPFSPARRFCPSSFVDARIVQHVEQPDSRPRRRFGERHSRARDGRRREGEI